MILGIDISHWQTNDAKNPQRFFDPFIAKEKGVEFGYLRSSDGAANDRAFQTFAETFRTADLPFGVYHYARPAGSIYGTALQQANRFWDLIKDTGFTLAPALDLECDGVGLSFTKVFLERINELSGITPVIYTSPGFWSGLRDSNNAIWAIEYPLWLANYFSSLTFPQYGIPDRVRYSTTLPTLPDPWKKKGKTWSIWQYCATGDGEYYGGNYANGENKAGLDLDVYHGTLEELLDELGNGAAIEPPEPQPKRIQIICPFLRGRSTPKYFEGTSAVIFEQGQILYRTDEEPVYEPASGITWIQVKIPDCTCAKWVSSNPKYIKEL